MGASPMKGLTAMTQPCRRSASRIPAHSRIGDTLVTGLLGPITTASLASMASSTSGVATGASRKRLTTPSSSRAPRCFTQYSWKCTSPWCV